MSDCPPGCRVNFTLVSFKFTYTVSSLIPAEKITPGSNLFGNKSVNAKSFSV